MRRILYNAIKTPDGTVLESFHIHDFKLHTDKNSNQYGVDGGNDYLKRIGNFKDCTDLSVYDDGLQSTRREFCHWGVNFDKNMNPLEFTKWVKIKDLDTDHIYNILQLSNLDSFYREVLMDEIVEREMKYCEENELDYYE